MSLFAERLKQLRGNSPQAEVAKKIGITAQTLGRYENDQRKPDIEVIVMLCKHYGVSAEYLLGFSDVVSAEKDYELKPCPFCGKEPYSRVIVLRGGASDHVVIEVGCQSCETKQRTDVQSGESMESFGKAKKTAFDKWNGRA